LSRLKLEAKERMQHSSSNFIKDSKRVTNIELQQKPFEKTYIISNYSVQSSNLAFEEKQINYLVFSKEKEKPRSVEKTQYFQRQST